MVGEWRPIPSFPSYEASTLGEIRRIGSTNPRKSFPNNIGYPTIILSVRCAPHQRKVHRLVAETFLGKIPVGMHINHKNGIKHDNRVDNLEIVTPFENARHYHQVILGKKIIMKAREAGKPLLKPKKKEKRRAV